MDALSLVARLTLNSDDYNEKLGNASKSAGSFGQKISKGLSSAMKGLGVAITGAATAVGAFVKSSVEGYGEFEQLTGGIQKLYGNMGMSLTEYAESVGKPIQEVGEEYYKLQAAQDAVMANARQAFRTTGMSANQYMNNITGFSAALINSVGGDTLEAANLADMAMRDIADNANTFGKYTAEELAGVYQALAKGQYQTLDNLNLGYGGTKEGMQGLIEQAMKLDKSFVASRDANGDLAMSYADIVQAIHIVQTDMNITGTTAREAASTIQGSLGMAKAAWQNLVAGFSDSEADMDSLMSDMIDSVIGYTDETGEHVNGVLDNILPAVETALSGIGSAIEKVIPIVSQKLPGIMQSILPSLLSASTSLVTGLISALPGLVGIVVDALPDVISTIWDTIVSLTNEYSPELGSFLEGVGEQFGNIAAWFSENSEGILSILESIGNAIAACFGWIAEHGDLVTGILAAILGGFMAYQTITGIIQAVAAAQTILNVVMAANPIGLIVIAIAALVAAFVTLWNTSDGFRDAVTNAWNSIVSAATALRDGVVNAFNSVKSTITGMISSAVSWGRDLIDNFVSGIKAKIQAVKDTISNVAGTVKSLLGFSEPEEGPLSNFHTYAPDMMKLFAQGVKDNEDMVRAQVAKSFDFGNVGTIGADYSGNGAGVTYANTYNFQVVDRAMLKQIMEYVNDELGVVV